MNEFDDQWEPNEFDDLEKFERKLEKLHKAFFETLFIEIEKGGKVDDDDDIRDAIEYFTELEEYEKCIILKKALK